MPAHIAPIVDEQRIIAGLLRVIAYDRMALDAAGDELPVDLEPAPGTLGAGGQ